MYAPTLTVLGSGPSGGSAFISPDLGAAADGDQERLQRRHVRHRRHRDRGGLQRRGGASLTTGYHAWADPVSTSTGTRYFGTNTTGTIWQSTGTLSGMGDAATPAAPALRFSNRSAG